MWTPFSIDAKGGEMKTKGEMHTSREHELLSSMTKGEIVDEIVIQHGLAVAPQDVIDATKSQLQCLDPLQSGFAPCSALDPLQ